MKIKEILQKQGKIYKNLTSNKNVQKYNETIEKPKPPKLVPYRGYRISEQEYKVITELEKMLNREPALVSNPNPAGHNFEILIEFNRITYLKIRCQGLGEIPEQINNLTNLEILNLSDNEILKIKGLNKLQNLRELYLYLNQIREIKNLDNLTNLQKLDLDNNKIKEIKGLDNLTNLQELLLYKNKIKKIEGLDNLKNLEVLDLSHNPIKNKNEVKDNLIKSGIWVEI